MENTNDKKPLAGVSEDLRGKLIAKPGNKFIFGTRTIDLREINDAQAQALAQNPNCMFLIFKDASKRPPGQKGWLHEQNAPTEPEAKKAQAPATAEAKK